MEKNRRRITACILSCVLLLSLAACGDKSGESDDNTTNIGVQQDDFEQEQKKLTAVETKFGTLYYRLKWQPDMKIKKSNAGSSCSLTFSTKIDKKEFILFYVYIGKQEGEKIGVLTDSNGKQRDVYASLPELEGIEELSDGEKDKLYAMQESINDIMANLK